MTKNRIKYIDVLKFVGILMVIFDHTCNFLNSYDTSYPLRKFICSCFMPLFFISYGLVVDLYNFNLWKTLLKKFKEIMIPYFLWAIIYKLFYTKSISVSSLVGIFYASNKSLQNINSNSVLWFLPAFFIATILCQLTLKINKKMLRQNVKSKKIIIFLILFAFINCTISIILLKLKPQYTILTRYDYPLSIDVAFFGSAFMILGFVLKNVIGKIYINKNTKKNIIIGISSILIMYILIQFNWCYNNQYNIAWGQYGKNYIIFILYACITNFGLINICMILENNKFMNFIGSNSITVFSTHYLIFSVTVPISKVLSEILANNNIYAPMLVTLFNVLITVLISIPMILIINKYFPFLRGKYKLNLFKKEVKDEN